MIIGSEFRSEEQYYAIDGGYPYWSNFIGSAKIFKYKDMLT